MANFSPKPQRSTRPCTICNSADSYLLFQQVFSTLSGDSNLLSGYEVVSCSKCGFCYADKIPDQAAFDTYYRDMSKYEKTGSNGLDTIEEKSRFQTISNVILELLPSRNTNIFEVGCANGQLLSLLKNQGYKNVSGIDPSPICAQIARDVFNIPVTANTISDLPITKDSVDFLILIGVLEHIRDINHSLQLLRQLVSPGGHIFITVPDASRYHEGDDAPFQEFSVEHINFFGPVSLENLLNENGFEKITSIQDMIEVNSRTRTPVIHALFKKSEIPTAFIFTRDYQTELNLKKYIEQSTQENRITQSRIDKVIESEKTIIIWGTGAHTLRLLSTSKLKEAKIRVFVDSNSRYQGKTLNGFQIINPNQLKEFTDPILISSRVYQDEIENQIRFKLKLENEIIKLY